MRNNVIETSQSHNDTGIPFLGIWIIGSKPKLKKFTQGRTQLKELSTIKLRKTAN